MAYGQDYRHAEAYAMLYLLATRHLITNALLSLNPQVGIAFDSSPEDLLIVLTLGSQSVTLPLGMHAFRAALTLGAPSESFLSWIEQQTGDPEHAILTLREQAGEQRLARLFAQQMLSEAETRLAARQGVLQA